MPVRRHTLRILSALRPVAMPRMKRLAVRKAHADIARIRVCGQVKGSGSTPFPAARTTAGTDNGRKNPNAMLTRTSRPDRQTMSPPPAAGQGRAG